jgi:hypothetical protein
VTRTLPLRAVALLTALATAVACHDSEPTIVATPTDNSLIGTWKGTVTASADNTTGAFILTLKADSTGSALTPAANPNCPTTGPWTVVQDRLSMSTRDCIGTAVSFSASLRGAHLIGTWSAGQDAGTFDVTKQ